MRFLRKPEVLELTGLCHSTMYRDIKLGIFPKPVKVGNKASRWVEAEIRNWMEQRIANRDAAA